MIQKKDRKLMSAFNILQKKVIIIKVRQKIVEKKKNKKLQRFPNFPNSSLTIYN